MGFTEIPEEYLKLPQFIHQGPVNCLEGEFLLDSAESLHLTGSRRMIPGQLLRIADGSGHVMVAEFVAKDKKRAIMRKIAGPWFKDDTVPVTMLVAPLKKDRFDLAISKLSEIGVSRVVPFITQRVRAKNFVHNFEKRLKRWSRLALEALKQSRGFKATEIATPIEVENVETLEVSGPKMFAWEGLCGTGSTLLSENRFPKVVAIGPEGGFTAEEVLFLKEKGFKAFGLGNRILRSETAAIFTASILCQMTAKRVHRG